MLYVLGEILVWVILAFVLGAVIGWLCRAVTRRRRPTRAGATAIDRSAVSVAELEHFKTEAGRQRERRRQVEQELGTLREDHEGVLFELDRHRQALVASTEGTRTQQQLELEAVVRSMRTELDQSEAARAGLEAELTEVASERERLAECVPEHERMLREATGRDAELRAELGNLSERGAEQQQTISTLTDRNAEHVRVLTALTAEKSELERTISQVSKEKADLERSLAALVIDKAALQTANDELQVAKATAEASMAAFRGGQQAQETALMNLRSARQAAASEIAELRTRQATVLAQLATTRAAAQETSSAAERRLAELTGRGDEQRVRIASSDVEIDRLRGELQTLHDELAGWKDRVQTLEGDLGEAAGRHDGLTTELSRAAERQEQLEAEVVLARKREETLHDELRSAKNLASEHEAARAGFASQLEAAQRRAEADRAAALDALADRDATISEFDRRIAILEGQLNKPEPDDLKLISGVGPVLERLLNDSGIRTYRELARLSDRDLDALDDRTAEFSGRIRTEGWLEQARLLHRGKYGDDPLR